MSDRKINKYVQFGPVLKRARRAAGLTQEKLAEEVDISVNHLKHIEGGLRNPSWSLLVEFVQRLNISLDSMFLDERQPTAHQLEVISRVMDWSDQECVAFLNGLNAARWADKSDHKA